MKVILNLLGFVLHIANSDPPRLRQPRDDFFDLKDAILKRYGTLLTAEIQHIKKECWLCGGSGKFERWDGNFEPCRKCGGTGIFDEFWVILSKYRLGRHCFHMPVVKYHRRDLDAKGYRSPEGQMINGYVVHGHYRYHLSCECFYWLTLFFNPRFFLRSIGCSKCLGPRFTPMVLMGNGIYSIKNGFRQLKRGFMKLSYRILNNEIQW